MLWAASRATPSVPFAPLALAERLVRLVPGDLATLSIEQLGHAAIPLLTAGMVAALLGVGAAVPALVGNGGPRRSRFIAAAFFVVLLAAALTYRLPGSSWLGLLAGSMAGAVLYSVTVEWLAELALRRDRPADASRRAALGWLVLAAGGLLTSGTLLGRLAARRGSAVTLAAADQTARIPERPPFPVVAGLAPEVTTPREHYVVDIAIVDPVVVAEDRRLQLDGMVRRPLQLGADAAGFVSFVSPCCLPLVPGYLAAVSGVAPGERHRRLDPRVLARSLVFVASFSSVFIVLGLSSTLLGSFLFDNQPLLNTIAGGAIVAMGALFIASLFVPRLNVQWRPAALLERAGRGGPVVAGVAFAIGWTPCVGPTLGAILGIAATQAGTGEGAFLLGIYSAGLAIVFLLAAVAFTGSARVFGFFGRHHVAVTVSSGLLLIAMGALVSRVESSLTVSGRLAAPDDRRRPVKYASTNQAVAGRQPSTMHSGNRDRTYDSRH